MPVNSGDQPYYSYWTKEMVIAFVIGGIGVLVFCAQAILLYKILSVLTAILAVIR